MADNDGDAVDLDALDVLRGKVLLLRHAYELERIEVARLTDIVERQVRTILALQAEIARWQGVH